VSFIILLTLLLFGHKKTLEFVGFDFCISFDTHMTGSYFDLMEKVLETYYDPSTYEKSKGKIEWEKAMVVEYDSLIKNHT